MILKILTVTLICCFSLTLTKGNRYLSYGPDIKATLGQVWPKPLWQDDTGRYFAVDPNNFQLVVGYTYPLIHYIKKKKRILFFV